TAGRDYEAQGEWVRRHGRRKGASIIESLELVDILDRDALLDDERLSFIERHFRSEYEANNLPSYRTDNDTLHKLVASAESESNRWRGMYRLVQALSFAGPQRLRPLLREYVAPCFFRLYPGGRVAIVRYNLAYDSAAAMLRMC